MSPKLILILLLSLSFVAPLSHALAEDSAGEDEQEVPEADSPEQDSAEEEVMDDEEDLELDDEVEEPLEEGMDDEGIYNRYKEELRGEDPIEESDAWSSYLDTYPRSLYRLEIENRIEALDEASFDQLELPSTRQNTKSTGEEQKDARRAEMDLREPALLGMNANTRRRLDVGILWGFQDYFNYEIAFEWAFRRQFSAFGAIRHSGRGFGTGVQAGAKYALIKDTRTGLLLSGAFSINLGYSALDGLNFVVQPWIGFGWVASKLIQLQTSLSMDLRVDQLHTAVLWDLMLIVSPTDRFSVYLQSKQKHSLIRPEGQPVRYLGFHQAGVGVKIRPTSIIEITLGANIPYGWKHWKDYRYIGAHAGLTFYFKKAPLN